MTVRQLPSQRNCEDKLTSLALWNVVQACTSGRIPNTVETRQRPVTVRGTYVARLLTVGHVEENSYYWPSTFSEGIPVVHISQHIFITFVRPCRWSPSPPLLPLITRCHSRGHKSSSTVSRNNMNIYNRLMALDWWSKAFS